MTKHSLFYNGSIYSRPDLPPETALLIADERVQALGAKAKALALGLGKLDRINLHGGSILPGFCDAHLHLQYLGERLSAVDCSGSSKKEILARVQARCRELREDEWLIGYGWDQNDWPEQAFGHKDELDAISEGHPVLLHAKSLHAVWVNSLALQRANINDDSPNPPGGQFQRDQNGRLSGILLENAIPLLTRVIPPKTPEQIAEEILHAQTQLHRIGITAVHDFDGQDCARALQALISQNRLRLRVAKSMPFTELPMERVSAEDLRAELSQSPWMKAAWAKTFADGALGPHTAALLTPYEGSANCGMLLQKPEELGALIRRAFSAGWPVAVHAIGDRAVRTTLDAFAIAPRSCLPLPSRIEHIQLIALEDLPRFARLGLVASVQPLHAVADRQIAEEAWGARCNHAYPYAELLTHAPALVIGTDAPVESFNPFASIYVAVSRQTPSADSEEASWHPEQCLPLKEAWLSATLRPAQISPFAEECGQLLPGYQADLIQLERDPFALPLAQLPTLRPLAVMIGGEFVLDE